MKKFAKSSLIVALSMLAVGFILIIICIIVGGASLAGSIKNDVLQNERISDLFGDTIARLDGDESPVEFTKDKPIFSGKHENTSVATSNEISNLNIDFGGGKCIITESSDESFHIYTEDTEKFQYYIEGQTLYINGFDDKLFQLNTSDKNQLQLEIPKNFLFKDIHIELGAGYLEAASLAATDTIELEIGAGELITDKLLADTLNIELGAGNIEIDDATIQDSDVTIGLGNLTFNGRIEKDLNAECGMGNLEFFLDDSKDNHNYNIDCNMGNLTVGNKSYSGISHSNEIDNDADSTYTLECGMGNLTVEFQ